MPHRIQSFIEQVSSSLRENNFVKMTLSRYQGKEAELQSAYIKLIELKSIQTLNFVYRYQKRDVTKNYELETGLKHLQELIAVNAFRGAHLFTLTADYTLNISKKGLPTLKSKKPTFDELPTRAHDKAKNRKITPTKKSYLHALNITDAEGKVYKNTQDKFKQINHYIEILSSLLKSLPERKVPIQIVDMGSGKGYLTFALYDYLNHTLSRTAHITGVEFRKDLVDLCNDVAKISEFEQLNFVEGTIEKYKHIAAENINVLIALHACDTATDEAIYQGIVQDADLIVVAPCCHKQIRREMEAASAVHELEFLTKYGIFLERQAEMITDGMRALILEYFGYTTKVLEFVSDAHTPKNVLIVGTKQKQPPQKQAEILNQLKDIKKQFGIRAHHLETLLELESLQGEEVS